MIHADVIQTYDNHADAVHAEDGKLSQNKLFTVFKIAEVCNLKCPYCYFFFGGDQSFAEHPAAVPEDIVVSVARFLRQGVADLGLRRLDISFHGGEPLMVGKKRFRRICEILSDEIAGHVELRLNMQTNGALIDEEWADILYTHRVGVGVSIDGPKHIHDLTRIDKKNRGTYDQTLAGIRRMQQRAAGSVGGLGVIPSGVDARTIYNHFVRDLGIKVIDLLMPIQDWRNVDAAMVEHVTGFYLELFDVWMEDNDPKVEIRTLSDPLRAMLTDRGAHNYSVSLKDICDSITIRSNGDLCPDDTLSSLGPRYQKTGFNVRDNSLSQFMQAEFWEDIRLAAAEPAHRCVDCKWWGICRGGQAEHRFDEVAQFRRESVYCDTYQNIFERMYDRVTRSIDKGAVDARTAAAGSAAL